MLKIASNREFGVSPGWLETAAALPGRSALRMAVFVLGVAQNKGKRLVFVRQSELDEVDFNRITAYKALNQLRDAGLIRVNRYRRNSPIVEILDL